MGLEYEIKKPINLTKINNSDFGELLWWSYILGVTPEKLLTTIDRVGDSTELIKISIKEIE